MCVIIPITLPPSPATKKFLLREKNSRSYVEVSDERDANGDSMTLLLRNPLDAASLNCGGPRITQAVLLNPFLIRALFQSCLLLRPLPGPFSCPSFIWMPSTWNILGGPHEPQLRNTFVEDLYIIFYVPD